MKAFSEIFKSCFQGIDADKAIAATSLIQAWEKVAGEAVLKYTGAVFYDRKNPDIVVVYTISSFHKAELEAEKEIYRLRLTEILRQKPMPEIKEVRFAVDRKTFLDKRYEKRIQENVKTYVTPVPLTEEEDRHARESVAAITDLELKESLYKAMKTNLEWKKGKEAVKTAQERL